MDSQQINRIFALRRIASGEGVYSIEKLRAYANMVAPDRMTQLLDDIKETIKRAGPDETKDWKFVYDQLRTDLNARSGDVGVVQRSAGLKDATAQAHVERAFGINRTSVVRGDDLLKPKEVKLLHDAGPLRYLETVPGRKRRVGTVVSGEQRFAFEERYAKEFELSLTTNKRYRALDEKRTRLYRNRAAAEDVLVTRKVKVDGAFVPATPKQIRDAARDLRNANESLAVLEGQQASVVINVENQLAKQYGITQRIDRKTLKELEKRKKTLGERRDERMGGAVGQPREADSMRFDHPLIREFTEEYGEDNVMDVFSLVTEDGRIDYRQAKALAEDGIPQEEIEWLEEKLAFHTQQESIANLTASQTFEGRATRGFYEELQEALADQGDYHVPAWRVQGGTEYNEDAIQFALHLQRLRGSVGAQSRYAIGKAIQLAGDTGSVATLNGRNLRIVTTRGYVSPGLARGAAAKRPIIRLMSLFQSIEEREGIYDSVLVRRIQKEGTTLRALEGLPVRATKTGGLFVTSLGRERLELKSTEDALGYVMSRAGLAAAEDSRAVLTASGMRLGLGEMAEAVDTAMFSQPFGLQLGDELHITAGRTKLSSVTRTIKGSVTIKDGATTVEGGQVIKAYEAALTSESTEDLARKLWGDDFAEHMPREFIRHLSTIRERVRKAAAGAVAKRFGIEATEAQQLLDQAAPQVLAVARELREKDGKAIEIGARTLRQARPEVDRAVARLANNADNLPGMRAVAAFYTHRAVADVRAGGQAAREAEEAFWGIVDTFSSAVDANRGMRVEQADRQVRGLLYGSVYENFAQRVAGESIATQHLIEGGDAGKIRGWLRGQVGDALVSQISKSRGYGEDEIEQLKTFIAAIEQGDADLAELAADGIDSEAQHAVHYFVDSLSPQYLLDSQLSGRQGLIGQLGKYAREARRLMGSGKRPNYFRGEVDEYQSQNATIVRMMTAAQLMDDKGNFTPRRGSFMAGLRKSYLGDRIVPTVGVLRDEQLRKNAARQFVSMFGERYGLSYDDPSFVTFNNVMRKLSGEEDLSTNLHRTRLLSIFDQLNRNVGDWIDKKIAAAATEEEKIAWEALSNTLNENRSAAHGGFTEAYANLSRLMAEGGELHSQSAASIIAGEGRSPRDHAIELNELIAEQAEEIALGHRAAPYVETIDGSMDLRVSEEVLASTRSQTGTYIDELLRDGQFNRIGNKTISSAMDELHNMLQHPSNRSLNVKLGGEEGADDIFEMIDTLIDENAEFESSVLERVAGSEDSRWLFRQRARLRGAEIAAANKLQQGVQAKTPDAIKEAATLLGMDPSTDSDTLLKGLTDYVEAATKKMQDLEKAGKHVDDLEEAGSLAAEIHTAKLTGARMARKAMEAPRKKGEAVGRVARMLQDISKAPMDTELSLEERLLQLGESALLDEESVGEALHAIASAPMERQLLGGNANIPAIERLLRLQKQGEFDEEAVEMLNELLDLEPGGKLVSATTSQGALDYVVRLPSGEMVPENIGLQYTKNGPRLVPGSTRAINVEGNVHLRDVRAHFAARMSRGGRGEESVSNSLAQINEFIRSEDGMAETVMQMQHELFPELDDAKLTAQEFLYGVQNAGGTRNLGEIVGWLTPEEGDFKLSAASAAAKNKDATAYRMLQAAAGLQRDLEGKLKAGEDIASDDLLLLDALKVSLAQGSTADLAGEAEAAPVVKTTGVRYFANYLRDFNARKAGETYEPIEESAETVSKSFRTAARAAKNWNPTEAWQDVKQAFRSPVGAFIGVGLLTMGALAVRQALKKPAQEQSVTPTVESNASTRISMRDSGYDGTMMIDRSPGGAIAPRATGLSHGDGGGSTINVSDNLANLSPRDIDDMLSGG